MSKLKIYTQGSDKLKVTLSKNTQNLFEGIYKENDRKQVENLLLNHLIPQDELSIIIGDRSKGGPDSNKLALNIFNYVLKISNLKKLELTISSMDEKLATELAKYIKSRQATLLEVIFHINLRVNSLSENVKEILKDAVLENLSLMKLEVQNSYGHIYTPGRVNDILIKRTEVIKGIARNIVKNNGVESVKEQYLLHKTAVDKELITINPKNKELIKAINENPIYNVSETQDSKLGSGHEFAFAQREEQSPILFTSPSFDSDQFIQGKDLAPILPEIETYPPSLPSDPYQNQDVQPMDIDGSEVNHAHSEPTYPPFHAAETNEDLRAQSSVANKNPEAAIEEEMPNARPEPGYLLSQPPKPSISSDIQFSEYEEISRLVDESQKSNNSSFNLFLSPEEEIAPALHIQGALGKRSTSTRKPLIQKEEEISRDESKPEREILFFEGISQPEPDYLLAQPIELSLSPEDVPAAAAVSSIQKILDKRESSKKRNAPLTDEEKEEELLRNRNKPKKEMPAAAAVSSIQKILDNGPVGRRDKQMQGYGR